MPMRTSPAGRAAITLREGVRLRAYKDSVGVWTIGVGHTGRASSGKVWPWSTITQAQADAYLAADLAPMEAAVNRAVKVALTQNQFDACVSLAFNIGASGFIGSSVVHLLNLGKPAEAAQAFLMWNHPSVLLGRRIAERQQFLTPDKAPIAANTNSAPVRLG